MKKEFLTDEERLFLEENLADVIELFKQTFLEIKEELKIIYDKKGFFEHSSYNCFVNWRVGTFFNCGYCFYFARIMKTIFQDAEFIFVVSGGRRTHVFLKNKGMCFDINMIKPESNCQSTCYKDADNSDFEYARNKFRKMDQELYEKLKYKFYRNIKEYLNKEMSLKCIVKTK